MNWCRLRGSVTRAEVRPDKARRAMRSVRVARSATRRLRRRLLLGQGEQPPHRFGSHRLWRAARFDGGKQVLKEAARQVILLADHSKFDADSVAPVGPVETIDKLITDNALPASTRLELGKRGVEIVLAET